MKRSFSKRETILLLILAILLLALGYYMAVDQPVRNAILDAESRELAAEDMLMVENVRLEKMIQMQKALEEVSGEATAVVPDYDNSRKVIELLGSVLADTYSYSLDFEPVTFSDKIAVRTVNMNFTCADSNRAEQVVRDLVAGGYRCEISPVTFTADGTGTAGQLMDGAVTANLSVTFFEYVPSQAPSGTEEPEADGETEE